MYNVSEGTGCRYQLVTVVCTLLLAYHSMRHVKRDVEDALDP